MSIEREEAAKKVVEKMELKELYGVAPLFFDNGSHVDNEFKWYKINNEEEAEMLSIAMDYTPCETDLLPEIVCVESNGYEAEIHYLSCIIYKANKFFKNFNYSVDKKTE